MVKYGSILTKIEVAPPNSSFEAYLYNSKNQGLKIPTLLASNHQNLTPIDELKPFLVVVCYKTPKNWIFVKSLNFPFYGTPQTGRCGAIRRLKLSST